MKYIALLAAILLLIAPAFADGPKDNDTKSIRPIPPVGLEIPADVAKELQDRCQGIRDQWASDVETYRKRTETNNKYQRAWHEGQLAKLTDLAPEVLVFPRAIELALEFRQFYKERDFEVARRLLDLAAVRSELAAQDPRWSTVVGLNEGEDQQLIIGGFQSRIDGSHQPYALVVPSGFKPGDSRPRRLDVWFHGRGETLSEANFLEKGRTNAGQYTPADTFVLHPYGRYSNAFKFAGEIDVLEGIEYLEKRLPVNPDRVSVRGFSMGGAACWQFATHYAGTFFAANPGAGFSETPEFLKSFQGEDLSATPDYQRTLWQLYDCPPWSRNLLQCPTVAYSGEIDRQKQAADVMEAALADHDIDMVHVIGPQTGHKIHEDSKVEIEQRMDDLVRHLETETPEEIDFTTYTLRYHKMHWVDVQGLGQHWKRAHVHAELEDESVEITTENVTRLNLSFDAGQWDGDFPCRPVVTIDGSQVSGPLVRSDRSWSIALSRGADGAWAEYEETDASAGKRPGLQGPIDDAFLDSFAFVLPSGTSSDAVAEAWFGNEADHAMLHWRKHFRGDINRIDDGQLNEATVAADNLVLFGDPDSNTVLAKIADKLPVRWTEDKIELGGRAFPRAGHAVVMIYPNPMNPDRYVVLNSGFTFREYDYLNNARQTPKLPDWAIVDVTEGSTGRDPGKIIAAGFFDENWQPK